MPARSLITGRAIPAASGVTLLARIRGQDDQLVTAASISSITWQVTNLTAGTVAGIGTFSPAEAILEALVQDDRRWDQDSAAAPNPEDESWGYNFLAVIPAVTFPASVPAPPNVLAGRTSGPLLQADVTFTPVTGEPFVLVCQWRQVVTYA